MSSFLDHYLKALAAKENSGPEARVIPMVRMGSTAAGALRPSDAVITVAAARVSDKPGFDWDRAVRIARVFIKGSPTPVKLRKEFKTQVLGRVSFISFELEWEEAQGGVLEACYLSLRRDYALVISVVAKNPKSFEKAKKTLRSLTFPRPGTASESK